MWQGEIVSALAPGNRARFGMGAPGRYGGGGQMSARALVRAAIASAARLEEPFDRAVDTLVSQMASDDPKIKAAAERAVRSLRIKMLVAATNAMRAAAGAPDDADAIDTEGEEVAANPAQLAAEIRRRGLVVVLGRDKEAHGNGKGNGRGGNGANGHG